jgi:uncharacterized membrane protein (UPF0127 family)
MGQTRIYAIIGLLVLIIASVPFAVMGQVDESQITLPPWRRELPAGREIAEITVGETPLTVDLAVTGFEQALGLGYRNGLEPGTGMLFVGTEPRPKTFWMKGMRFCLDIVWIENGQIVGAAESVCPDPAGTPDEERARFASELPVTHVLEVPAGWLAEHGYGPGTPVDLSRVPGI